MSYSGIRTSSSSTGMEGTWTSTFAAAAVPEASVGWSRMLEPTSRAFHSQSSRWTAHNTSASWWCRNLISSYNAMSMSTVNLHSMLPQSRRAEYAGRPWVRRVSKSLWMLSIKRVKSQRCQVTCSTEQLAKNAIYHLCQYQHSNVTCSPLIKNIANFFFPLAHCSDYWHSTPHIFNTPSHTHTHIHTHTHTRLTALFPGLPRWAGTRKVKPLWILLKQETVSDSGISWAICKSALCSRQITTPAPHHSVFTGRMPFLPPNQQRQSTEGILIHQVNLTINCTVDCILKQP